MHWPLEGLVSILTHPIVQEDIEFIFKIVGNDLNRLQGKRILITGGTGFIGT
jgi:FlaA1/EpsC-like NDP-sugar epimerase